jgi:hypothetical protein
MHGQCTRHGAPDQEGTTTMITAEALLAKRQRQAEHLARCEELFDQGKFDGSDIAGIRSAHKRRRTEIDYHLDQLAEIDRLAGGAGWPDDPEMVKLCDAEAALIRQQIRLFEKIEKIEKIRKDHSRVALAAAKRDGLLPSEDGEA